VAKFRRFISSSWTPSTPLLPSADFIPASVDANRSMFSGSVPPLPEFSGWSNVGRVWHTDKPRAVAPRVVILSLLWFRNSANFNSH